ncbi:hypothetical protein BH23PLA1_BH23PLA1_08710 [soil metagenome]
MVEYDYIDWDDPDDPDGNVQHIAENGVTTEEFEEILASPTAIDKVSRSTGRPVRFGWTETGKHLIVVYEIEDEGGFAIVRPITAYEVPPRI